MEQFTAECEASGMRMPGLRNKLSLEISQYTKLLCLTEASCQSEKTHKHTDDVKNIEKYLSRKYFTS